MSTTRPTLTRRHVLASAAALTLVPPALAASVRIRVNGLQDKPLEDAVVMLEPKAGRAPVRPMPDQVISQRRRRFEPAVSVVTAGTRVEFPNRDDVRHHVYSFSEAKRFELKLYQGRPEAPVTFDRAGLVVLGCNIHDHMVAWVVVSDTPWFARTPGNGEAQLPDVPPGDYRLRVWHPSMPPGATGEVQDVKVDAAGLNMTMGLKLRPLRLPEPSTLGNYQ